MTGNIIRLSDERPHEVQLLLPWYVTGQLEAADRARVETHLAACPECRAGLALEQRLADEVAALPVEVEHGWATLLHRVQNPSRPAAAAFGDRIAALGGRGGRMAGRAAPWLGWAAAASLAVALVIAPRLQTERPQAYHALAAPAAPAAASDIVTIFRPDASERAIRQALRDAGVRLKDGPTAADAYVLQAQPGQRDHALQVLRARRAVVLAEPIDGSEPP
jgi:anti-sigma factor RsiW